MMFLKNTQGENSRTAKLNEAQVRRIRKAYDKGKRGKDNAHKFGIVPFTYDQIGRRLSWKHLK